MDPRLLLSNAKELGLTVSYSTDTGGISIAPPDKAGADFVANWIRRWAEGTSDDDRQHWAELVSRLKVRAADPQAQAIAAAGAANRRLTNPSAFGDPSRWR